MVLTFPAKSPDPFHIQGTKGSALLLHGFTGTPYEIRIIGERLARLGFLAHGPLLPGHGQTPELLNKATAKDWIQAAKKAFETMPKHRPCVLVGLSMGGLLAAILAASYPKQVDKIVLLAPAFYLKPSASLALWLTQKGFGKKIILKKTAAGGDLLDPEGRKHNPNMRHTPLGALAEFGSVLEQAKHVLPQVSCPTLTLFGKKDHTINNNKTEKLLKQTLKGSFESVTFDNSAHILTLDYERTEVTARVLSFITGK